MTNSQRFQVNQADAVTWLRRFGTGTVDLVVTDPAYESMEKHRKVGTTTRLKNSASSSNAWFDIFPDSRYPEFFTELHRVLAKNSHCYIHCDQTTGLVIKPIAEEAGFKFWKFLVWDKMKMGMGYHYRYRHEWIGFFEKGKRRLASLSVQDILPVQSLRGKEFYPTQKPVELERILIEQSSSPGELVVDPFLGSGAVGKAALLTGRRFAGCDVFGPAVSQARANLPWYLDENEFENVGGVEK